MATTIFDQLLASLAVRLHASSICSIQQGWALSYPAFDSVTVHFVLRGSGTLRVGGGPAQSFGAASAIIVPALQPHVVGAAGPRTRLVPADEVCSLVGDGIVHFVAGSGRRDIVLLCGMIPAAFGHALDGFGLFAAPCVETFDAEPAAGPAFEQMQAEVARPRLGTHVMAEALMRQCLIALLRRRLDASGLRGPPLGSPHQDRLLRAALAVVERPAGPHSVASLASVAGMSRASFAEHFARSFRQGPIEFVQTVRLHVAARLLRTTVLPVKVIGHSVGYTAAAAFSRAFRARYGSDPVGYRGVSGG